MVSVSVVSGYAAVAISRDALLVKKTASRKTVIREQSIDTSQHFSERAKKSLKKKMFFNATSSRFRY